MRKCKVGRSCGKACIPKNNTCRRELSSSLNSSLSKKSTFKAVEDVESDSNIRWGSYKLDSILSSIESLNPGDRKEAESQLNEVLDSRPVPSSYVRADRVGNKVKTPNDSDLKELLKQFSDGVLYAIGEENDNKINFTIRKKEEVLSELKNNASDYSGSAFKKLRENWNGLDLFVSMASKGTSEDFKRMVSLVPEGTMFTIDSTSKIPKEGFGEGEGRSDFFLYQRAIKRGGKLEPFEKGVNRG